MNIKTLKITNFKSIQHLEIDFDNIKGFWAINGIVGAGKTTLGEAILFGLFGSLKGKNNPDLIHRGCKTGEVVTSLTSKGHDIVVTRTLKRRGQCPIDVAVDGSPLVFTYKRDAQEILEEEYYDTSRLVLEMLCIISFNGFKSISTLSGPDTKQFLDQVFGFGVLTEYSDRCKEFEREEIDGAVTLQAQKDAARESISKFEDWKKKEHTQPDDDRYDEYRQQIKTSQAALQNANNVYNIKYRKLQSEYNDLNSQLSKVKTLGGQKRKEIDFLKKGICPTCGAPLDQSHLEEHNAALEALLADYRTTASLLKDKREAMEALRQEHDVDINNIYKTINEIQTKVTRIDEARKSCLTMTVEIDKLKADMADIDRALEGSNKEIHEWEQLEDLLSHNIRYKILSSLIPYINKYMKQYMAELHQPYIVEFDNTFKCAIKMSMDNEPVPIGLLSTGQLKVVDMVIILSILKVLLSSVNFSIIFLDELLSNMHEELRDEMCKILKKDIAENQTIFIISHASLNEQYFDGVIEAELDPDEMTSSYTIKKLR